MERAAPRSTVSSCWAFPRPRSLVVSTYLLDMFARWVKLVAEGVSWNPKWYPDLVHVVTTRRAAQLSPAQQFGVNLLQPGEVDRRRVTLLV